MYVLVFAFSLFIDVCFYIETTWVWPFAQLMHLEVRGGAKTPKLKAEGFLRPPRTEWCINWTKRHTHVVLLLSHTLRENIGVFRIFRFLTRANHLWKRHRSVSLTRCYGDVIRFTCDVIRVPVPTRTVNITTISSLKTVLKPLVYINKKKSYYTFISDKIMRNWIGRYLWNISKLWMLSLVTSASLFEVLPLCFHTSHYLSNLGIFFVHLLVPVCVQIVTIKSSRDEFSLEKDLFTPNSLSRACEKYILVASSTSPNWPHLLRCSSQSNRRKILESESPWSGLNTEPHGPKTYIQVSALLHRYIFWINNHLPFTLRPEGPMLV